MDNKTLEFDAKNSVDLLYDDDDIMIVSLDLFHIDEDGECNRNNCNISKAVAEKSLSTFKNKPIIARFDSNFKDFVTDVTEHARNAKEEFEMRVVGHIPSDARIKFVERDNGKTYCNVEGIIQKKYLPQLVDIIKNNDGEMKISIEINVAGKENEDGVLVINKMKLLGICLLSNKVLEGIEGSHLEVLKFSKQELDSMNETYLKFSKSKESSRNIFDEIKNKLNKEETVIVNSMSLRELSDRLWELLRVYNYNDGNYELTKYYIEEIYPDDKDIIVRDNETAKYYRMKYSVDGTDVTIDETGKTEVEKGWHERPLNEQRFSLVFAKEDYGTGKEIKVDKSADAVSMKAWGDVDKTELRHKVLTAKNYKTLVHDVYAQVEEGWEDAPSEKLKYPIMLIEGDTAVYARYGLSSALGYAKAENNTSVVSKVEKLYKTINIEEKEDEMDGEKELQNKLDETNPEIEKIKDDADAIEDDKKEELQKEVDNAVVDAPEEDKLKDDIDADKDYWKKKYDELNEMHNAMQEEFESMKSELKVYKDKEDKRSMKKYLQSFKNCFNSEDFDVMASKIENTARIDFEKEVDDKVKAFVKKTYCGVIENEDDDDEEIVVKNSAGFMPNTETKSHSVEIKTIDDVLNTFNK